MIIELYEGTLRNRDQLCRELQVVQSPDRRDTERAILEAGWRRWGRELVGHLYGSFAFAIRDQEEGTLFCARDPFGIQSFYYHAAKDGAFLYGTDLGGIVSSPHYIKALDRQALQLYVLFGYPIGARTLYEGIRKLMPGCSLLWDGTSIQIDRWYPLSFRPEPAPSAEEWADRIDHTLQEILDEDRSNFDFTAAASFLSGGVDSSYLLAASGIRRAIGIGFQDGEADETELAAATAAEFGARFCKVRISAEEYFDVIPRFLRNAELPLADPSAPAFAFGCEQTTGETEVYLSGEGADEFFDGYYVYRRAEELGREDALYCGCYGVLGQTEGIRLLGGAEEAFPLETLVRETSMQNHGAEPLSRMLAVDIALWLEGDILFGVGRSARANGITLLLPFADRRMFELSAAIPAAFKRKDETAKYILRKAAETRLPHVIAFRPKVGFSVPVKRWFREERFRGRIERVLFGAASRACFDQEILQNCWCSFLEGSDEVWPIPYMVYIFVIWYENCFASDCLG